MKSPLYIRDPIDAINDKVAKAIEMIPKLEDTQIALLLLRQVNNGALTYTLRTTPPRAAGPLAFKLVERIKEALKLILNTAKTQINRAHSRVFLP